MLFRLFKCISRYRYGLRAAFLVDGCQYHVILVAWCQAFQVECGRPVWNEKRRDYRVRYDDVAFAFKDKIKCTAGNIYSHCGHWVDDVFVSGHVQLSNKVLYTATIVTSDARHHERVVCLINYSTISQLFWLSRWLNTEHTRIGLHADWIYAPAEHRSVIILTLRFEDQHVVLDVVRCDFSWLSAEVHRWRFEFPAILVCRRIRFNFAGDICYFTFIDTIRMLLSGSTDWSNCERKLQIELN